jgi:pimeloyl-ACP methyl ester carboxylesterase
MTVIRAFLFIGLLAAVATSRGQTPHGRNAGSRDQAADTARHRSAFVDRNGVRLHYLEWHGNGPTVVLLPGYLLTGHAFDEIGGLLSNAYRVIAVTPRGFGESSAPDTGTYTIQTMVDDLRTLLDSLGVRRAALVGHSMSGSTITAFAAQYPKRVSKLVYLDAFPYFLSAGGDSVEALSPVTRPPFRGPATYPRIRHYLTRYRYDGWSSGLEADMKVQPLGAEMTRRDALTDGFIRDQRLHPPDVAAVTAPALEICAVPSATTEYPWLQRRTAGYSRAAVYVRSVLRPFARELCERFATLATNGRTIDVHGSHYVFFTQSAMTAHLIRRFLLQE